LHVFAACSHTKTSQFKLDDLDLIDAILPNVVCVDVPISDQGNSFYRPLPKHREFREESFIFPFEYKYFDPYYNWDGIDTALKPYNGEPVSNIDDESWTHAKAVVLRMFAEKVSKSSEIEYSHAIEELKMKKSPGFPYNIDYDDKRDVFMCIPEVVKARSDAFMYSDEVNDVYWYVFAKKELLSVKKVNNNKIRTIQVPPVDLLLSYIRTFQLQNEMIMNSGLVAVGDKLEYGGFTEWCNKRRKYNCFLEIDGDQFDRSLINKIMEAIRDIRKNLHYAPEVVQRLYKLLIKVGLVDGRGKVHFKDHGNPSGSFNTIYDNCMASWLILAYVVIRCEFDFDDWIQHCKVDVLGDDLLLCMKTDYQITYDEFAKYSAELGMKYSLARESDSLIGHSFYGQTVTYSDEFKCFVGYPNFDKLKAKLCYLPKANEECQEILRSLYSHFYVDKDLREQFKLFVSDLSAKRQYNFLLPSDYSMEVLILGWRVEL